MAHAQEEPRLAGVAVVGVVSLLTVGVMQVANAREIAGAGSERATVRASAGVDAQVVESVAKNERMSPERVRWLLKRERVLSGKDTQVRADLRPEAMAGSWIDRGTGKLVVAVTDDAAAEASDDADIEWRVVQRSLTELNRLKDKVDLAAERYRPREVSWFVDEPRNLVAVKIGDRQGAGTADFAQAVHGLGAGVEVTTDAEPARLLAGIEDGDEITSLSLKSCSAGWWVRDWSGADLVMTAGHCMEGDGGDWHHRALPIGGSVKSGNGLLDWALIRVDDIAAPRPTTRVNLYDGNSAKISGFSRAPIGATVCKSGTTTKQTCGPVTAYDVAVTDKTGTQFAGMALADLCGGPGNSGGPVYQFDPDREGHVLAQGILSLRVGGCPDGDTYYTPLDSALSDSETTFVTSTD